MTRGSTYWGQHSYHGWTKFTAGELARFIEANQTQGNSLDKARWIAASMAKLPEFSHLQSRPVGHPAGLPAAPGPGPSPCPQPLTAGTTGPDLPSQESTRMVLR